MSSAMQYRYPDGSDFVGPRSEQGQRHGLGQMSFPDGSSYTGRFVSGLSEGLGVMIMADGSRYEGEFADGKFNGVGVFERCDNMKYEGEFRHGKVWGLGLLTFADGTHGLPRNEGYFEGNALIRREKCPMMVGKSRQIADKARNQRI